jgi:osmotically-inducible protein OsmY
MGNHDAVLLDRVDVILSTSPYLSRRKVRLETESGRVTLRGEVDSFFQKQMAQEAIRRLDGVREIQNELEVVQFS